MRSIWIRFRLESCMDACRTCSSADGFLRTGWISRQGAPYAWLLELQLRVSGWGQDWAGLPAVGGTSPP